MYNVYRDSHAADIWRKRKRSPKGCRVAMQRPRESRDLDQMSVKEQNVRLLDAPGSRERTTGAWP